MAAPDIPVWSFRANWQTGVTERLSFLTDVIRAAEGAEQRRCLRPTPRRTVEADFLLKGPERAFYDLFINRLGGGEMLAPLYWDTATLLQPSPAGSTLSLFWDNPGHEFAIGDYALILGKTALESEVVEIVNLDDFGATIAEETSRSWPRGAQIVPLRRALIDEAGSPSHVTAGIATVSLRFLLTAPNPWATAADDSPVYDGRPVFLDEPNWVEPLDVSFDRDTVRLDNTITRPYQVDPTGRATLGQVHRWFLHGRESQTRFRDLLYQKQGRVASFWLPTFKHDLRLVNSPGAGATQITVENVGFIYTGGPTSGREYIAIKHAGGTIIRKITSAIPGLTAATERLNLDAPLGLDLSPGLVRRISFADIARFDQDDFEITHHAGIDGLAECQALFRTFKATRTAPEPISVPIPLSTKTLTPCGQNPLAWYIPCNPGSVGAVCSCPNTVEVQYRVKGDPDTLYPVLFRVRGVIEGRTYSGGTPVGSSGRCIKDPTGGLSGGGLNIYRLDVSSPAATYVFNHLPAATFIAEPVDYMAEVLMNGGALLTFIGNAIDGAQHREPGATVADDDPNNPIMVYQPFDGQFLQLDGSLPGT